MNAVEQDLWDTKRFLIECAYTRPKAKIVDYVKRVYQSEFGGAHMVRDEASSLRGIREEVAGLTEKQRNRKPYFEPFFGAFCRMNLSVSQEISPELMNRIFMLSSREIPKGARIRFEEKLRLFLELCQEQIGLFHFSVEEVKDYLREYRAAGYPAVHHSEEYIKAYSPAYRVVRKEFSPYIALYAAIEKCLHEKGSVNIAIDGNAASGKSTAASLIQSLFDCNVFHSDDFFLPLEKRTPERMAEVGGNMDRERFREEVCEGVRSGKPFSYRKFDCSTMGFGETVEVQPKKINVFEGAYSMHPDLQEYYDVKVFLSIPVQEQEARILQRNGNLVLPRFLKEWIPKENEYFDKLGIRQACDLIL